MSEVVLILAVGTAVLAILFGGRVAVRTVAGGATQQSDASEASAAAGSSATDVAGVIALPPLIFLGFLVAATVLEAIAPLPFLAAYAITRYLVGALLAVSGFVLIGMGTRRFVAASTNIPPNLPTTALVVDGIYGRTRTRAVSGEER